ncbi:hypothetical protein L596_009606 [Steinernema carpocapsae]|uniref:Uncharacterized protein n=1 Tax=Steinernema carpocapsae TaxID=34508 RepID=A0A4U5PGC5_STECR|nr:hypothetical protein L596_009606 [Steinernema carpocapsae]
MDELKAFNVDSLSSEIVSRMLVKKFRQLLVGFGLDRIEQTRLISEIVLKRSMYRLFSASAPFGRFIPDR